MADNVVVLWKTKTNEEQTMVRKSRLPERLEANADFHWYISINNLTVLASAKNPLLTLLNARCLAFLPVSTFNAKLRSA